MAPRFVMVSLSRRKIPVAVAWRLDLLADYRYGRYLVVRYGTAVVFGSTVRCLNDRWREFRQVDGRRLRKVVLMGAFC
jgi:hypothetical protein